MHRVPRVAQRAVDGFHWILLTGQDHQRDRAGFDQILPPAAPDFRRRVSISRAGL